MKLFIVVSTSILSFTIYRLFSDYQIRIKKEKLLINLGANFFIGEIKRIINENKYNLLEERRRLKEIDAYGNENLDKWFGNPPLDENLIIQNIAEGSSRFKEGIPYFWLKVILKNFVNIETFFEKWNFYKIKNPFIEDEILGIKRELNSNDWYVFVASLIEKSCLSLSKDDKHEINEKYKKGINFEVYCCQKLKSKGWKVELTPTSGDQGVDLIATIDKFRLCIQCKSHKKAVGNSAVQEIYAGKKYWLGTHAILVSKSGFTKSAHKLALSNKVILINEFELENIENIIF
tara:strand:+ start:33 stop:902 length:870 start_codon:yes stop_codon:yes gene_type:complete